MSRRHLTSADPLPPQKDGLLRIYSMLYCPFAQRARLVLEHKNIEYESVNINLTDKPTWMKAKNINTKVPILEMGDKLVYESLICMDYLDEAYPGNKLTPSDAFTKAKGRILVEEFSKVITMFYKTLRSQPEEHDENVKILHENMAAFENMMPTTKYLTGDDVGMADYGVWPWVERFPAMKMMEVFDLLKPDLYPRFCAWHEAMLETPGVKATIIQPEEFVQFLKGYSQGRVVDYDFAMND